MNAGHGDDGNANPGGPAAAAAPVEAATLEAAAPSALDPRVRRTRRRLGAALVALTLERGYHEVTIRDLTERADVGYATFFRHFHDKDELLSWLLDDLLEELMSLLGPLSADADAARTGTLVFAHAREHADLYRVLLRTNSSHGLLERATAVGIAGITQTFRERPGSEVPLEIAANHVIRAFIALIAWWLEHDLPYPPERMGRIYQQLILDPTRAVALEPRKA